MAMDSRDFRMVMDFLNISVLVSLIRVSHSGARCGIVSSLGPHFNKGYTQKTPGK